MINSRKSGFSLIELAMAVALIGLFTATCLQIWKVYKQEHLMAALSAINPDGPVDVAMRKFIIQNNRYPCPADPALPASNPASGAEQCDAGGAVAPGHCGGPAGGLCRVLGASGPDKDGNGIFDGPDSVLIGAIPYTALGLSARDTYDGWDRKFGYAVTASITAAPGAGAVANIGTISIIDGAAPPLTVPADYTQPLASRTNQTQDQSIGALKQHPFVIWSYGSSRRGGWTPDGQKPFPCDTTTRDGQNCDNADAVFLYSYNLPSPYPSIRSLQPGTNFYDSYITLYELGSCTGFWCLVPGHANSGAPSDQSTYVGIGNANPQAPLDVTGSIRAPKAIMAQYCTGANTNCFHPENIGGEPGMQCGGMAGIANDGPLCVNKPTGFPQTKCGGNQFANGVDPVTGAVQCINIP